MALQAPPRLLWDLTAGLVALVVTALAFRNRERAGAVPLAALMFVGSVWSFSEVATTMVTTLDAKIVLSRVQVVVAPLAPVAWLWFAVEYTGNDSWIEGRTIALVLLEPLVFGLVTLTAEPHELLRYGFDLVTIGGYEILTYSKGTVFLAHVTYSYVVFLAGAGLLLQLAFTTDRLYRDQSIALLVSVCGPLVANLLWLLDLLPPGIETSSGFVFTGVVLAIAIFRQRLLELVPVARELAWTQLVQDMEDRVLVLDTQDRIVDLNETASHLVGDGKESVVGEPLAEVLPELARALGETNGDTPESVMLPVEGVQRYFDVRVSRLRRGRGLAAGRLVSLRDITERRRREQRLDVLTRVLRHNLRNDMTSVIGFGQFIEQTTTDDDVENAAQRLLDKCWELSSLSDQAREVAETLDGADAELTRHDLPAVVSRTVTGVRERYPHVDIETSLLDAGYVVAVETLPKAVTQACENACKHNESDQPRVEISLDRCKQDGREWVRLVVEDNGPGIPEQDITALEKGFETSLNHSSGLGLWLVKWIVETSGGRVEFPVVDDGGRVVIYLPAAPGSSEAPKPDATARE